MASTNKKTKTVNYNHEGQKGGNYAPKMQLERLTLTSLLFEDNFYIDGQSQADFVKQACADCSIDDIKELAKETRSAGKLRHMPLFLMNQILLGNVKNGSKVGLYRDIADVIQRPDEITELVNMWLENRDSSISSNKMPHQLRRAIQIAFNKFDEYQLAKYNRNGKVTLKDALFLSHAKGFTTEQKNVLDRLVNDKLKTPDTWETRLSAGNDKNQSFTELLEAGKLGGMAILRNLRNMRESGVNAKLVDKELNRLALKSKILPFRYAMAAHMVPEWSDMIDRVLIQSFDAWPKLQGKTCVLIDLSGSMTWGRISAKSQQTPLDAAATLGAFVEGITDVGDFTCYTFTTNTKLVRERYRGLSMIEKIKTNQSAGGTSLHKAINEVRLKEDYDRLIVITDEQATDGYNAFYKTKPKGNEYIINVQPYSVGVDNRAGMHLINGFSERVIDYIFAYEEMIQVA